MIINVENYPYGTSNIKIPPYFNFYDDYRIYSNDNLVYIIKTCDLYPSMYYVLDLEFILAYGKDILSLQPIVDSRLDNAKNLNSNQVIETVYYNTKLESYQAVKVMRSHINNEYLDLTRIDTYNTDYNQNNNLWDNRVIISTDVLHHIIKCIYNSYKIEY